MTPSGPNAEPTRPNVLLIMADQRVARDIYGKVYSGDWAEFSAKADAWHTRKRWQRAST